nr:hypothetical protein [Aequorivita echinoideorum]
MHNYFFSDTAYNLNGFYIIDETLYAVVQQPFVIADSITDLTLVREFMSANGFVNIRRNDYFHSELGIIIEDLHDENVLANTGILYFIDTVFFINNDIFCKS